MKYEKVEGTPLNGLQKMFLENFAHEISPWKFSPMHVLNRRVAVLHAIGYRGDRERQRLREGADPVERTPREDGA